MFRLFIYISLTYNSYITQNIVSLEVWENLTWDPEITKLEEWRAELKRG